MTRVVLLLLLCWPFSATAADPDRTMPTFLPWTGTQLNLDESNSYLAFSLNRHFFRGTLAPLRLGLRLTTPIEGDRRVVTSRRNPAHFNFGYNVKFSITWDTSYWSRYDMALSERLRQHICPLLKKQGHVCHAKAVDDWRRAPKHGKQIQKWKQARQKLRRLTRSWLRQHHALQLKWYDIRQQIVRVTAQRLSQKQWRRCQRLVGAHKSNRRTITHKQTGPLSPYHKARALLQRRYLWARRCAAHLRLALLSHEAHITKATHVYERRRETLREQSALYDELRRLPLSLKKRERQPLANHLFPSVTMPHREQLYWALGFELFLGYDNIFLYRYPTAPRLEPLPQGSIQFGPTATLYVAPYFALTVRTGLELSKEVEIDVRERCVLQSQGAQNSIHTCEDAYFLVAHPWYTRLYVRTALTSMFQFESVALGAELRLSLENIGLDNLGEGTFLDTRIILFSLARTKSIYGRFTVGLGIVHVFGPTRRQRFLPGTTAVVPFVGVGGGF